jgi:hypothetical protein
MELIKRARLRWSGDVDIRHRTIPNQAPKANPPLSACQTKSQHSKNTKKTLLYLHQTGVEQQVSESPPCSKRRSFLLCTKRKRKVSPCGDKRGKPRYEFVWLANLPWVQNPGLLKHIVSVEGDISIDLTPYVAPCEWFRDWKWYSRESADVQVYLPKIKVQDNDMSKGPSIMIGDWYATLYIVYTLFVSNIESLKTTRHSFTTSCPTSSWNQDNFRNST